MGRRGEHSKEELAALALEAAVAMLEEEGPTTLTTRAVAGRIGYTVGSLYFLFRNRDDLILRINERTLDELRAGIEMAVADCREPRKAILGMGRAYLTFATAHPVRWRLIFEHVLPADAEVPAGLLAKIEDFFTRVAGYLSALAPERDPLAVRRSAQALWSGVHGITVLAITDKLVLGGDTAAEALTEDLIGRYLDGLGAR
ncbi:TetR/AcrR family transcriptional regulator [Thiocystis violascens]|uniref:Transcriptional regulator n=1 Tax=Thiocystis violascens (strain ATCC 17096 / DSM 198 / 6111) TaxID=765911 RepID=I3YGC9_THIV6|nr:TetR/AcrR family transcriptional regulator [Thiocystis violascens]AFL76047.1 transcriptional regulator [Thiocystis violascens DSM 198]